MYLRRMSKKRIMDRARERAVRRFKRKTIRLKRLEADIQAINMRFVALMTGVDIRYTRPSNPAYDEIRLGRA